jgi:hypothetical protein
VRILGVAMVWATTSANSCSLDPKYRLISIAVTPPSLAISRTPTPSYPDRAKARWAEARIAARVAAAFRRRGGVTLGAWLFFLIIRM